MKSSALGDKSVISIMHLAAKMIDEFIITANQPFACGRELQPPQLQSRKDRAERECGDRVGMAWAEEIGGAVAG